MSKIKKTLPEATGRIHKQYELPENNLRFSFKYLDFNDKFHIKEVSGEYLKVLLERLKSFSSLTVQDFPQTKTRHYALILITGEKP